MRFKTIAEQQPLLILNEIYKFMKTGTGRKKYTLKSDVTSIYSSPY